MNIKHSAQEILLVAMLIVTVTAACWLFQPRSSTEAEHAELWRLANTSGRISSGDTRLLDWCISLLHGSRPNKYFENRYYEAQETFLKSGYLVHTAIHVPNLTDKTHRLFHVVTNVAYPNNAWFEIRLNHATATVNLWCRKDDLPLWTAAFKELQ